MAAITTPAPVPPYAFADYHRIAACSAQALVLHARQRLEIRDPEGEQVADLVAYALDDHAEVLSSGRSLDYASKLLLSSGDLLYSNRSRPMLEIVEDTVGRHDFLLTPCSADTFRILYGENDPLPGCEGNLARVLAPHGIDRDRIPVAFNVFMHVAIEGDSGRIEVRPPLSRPGDRIVLEARMPLLVGLTACTAGQSNNFHCTPIDYRILDPA